MTIVAHLLKSKPHQGTLTTTPETSVFNALKLMAEKNVGALVVTQGDDIVGIISERDYARKVSLMGRASRDTPVSTIMSCPVICVGPMQSSEECMGLMTQHRLRHLPVIENGKLVGVISIGDLVKDIIAEQKFIIEQLEHYIMGVDDRVV